MYTPRLLQQPRDYLQAAVQMFNLSYGLCRVNAVYTRQKSNKRYRSILSFSSAHFSKSGHVVANFYAPGGCVYAMRVRSHTHSPGGAPRYTAKAITIFTAGRSLRQRPVFGFKSLTRNKNTNLYVT